MRIRRRKGRSCSADRDHSNDQAVESTGMFPAPMLFTKKSEQARELLRLMWRQRMQASPVLDAAPERSPTLSLRNANNSVGILRVRRLEMG